MLHSAIRMLKLYYICYEGNTPPDKSHQDVYRGPPHNIIYGSPVFTPAAHYRGTEVFPATIYGSPELIPAAHYRGTEVFPATNYGGPDFIPAAHLPGHGSISSNNFRRPGLHSSSTLPGHGSISSNKLWGPGAHSSSTPTGARKYFQQQFSEHSSSTLPGHGSISSNNLRRPGLHFSSTLPGHGSISSNRLWGPGANPDFILAAHYRGTEVFPATNYGGPEFSPAAQYRGTDFVYYILYYNDHLITNFKNLWDIERNEACCNSALDQNHRSHNHKFEVWHTISNEPICNQSRIETDHFFASNTTCSILPSECLNCITYVMKEIRLQTKVIKMSTEAPFTT
jgi:hypothetical protein